MNANAFPPPSGAPSLRLSASMEFAKASATTPPLSRNAVIAISVVVLHVLFIWALQSGLLMRAAEIIVPAEVLSQFIEPPAPKVEPVPPAPVTPPTTPKQPTPPKPIKTVVAKVPTQPAPQPLAIADPTPSPNAPVGVTTPQPAPAAIGAPVGAVSAAPAGPPSVQLPSSDASYLQNPKPIYPPVSRRMNEQGKTTVRVLIGVDGTPQRAEINTSSGYDRLDQAAITAVMRWRYVPGKRGGVPEAMWFNVPINWVLE